MALRKLKRVHKKLLREVGFNPSDYLYKRDTHKEQIFVNTKTKEEIRFLKNSNGKFELEGEINNENGKES